MNRKVTISDIAEALGISAISVSRALSGQSGVSKELRDKILLKSKEMGYVKTKNKNEYKILILHQKPFIQDNSNFSYMVQGLEKAIQKIGADYDIEFVDKDKQTKMELPYKLSKDNDFDGIIFMGRFNNDYVAFLREKISNLIFYTGYSPSFDGDSVWFNFNNGGYKQCEYLIKNGHKDIGFIGSNSVLFKNREKVLGITSALENYNIPINHEFFLYFQHNFDEKFEETILELLRSKDKPSAIICQWDLLALKLIKLLYENRIRVPEDLSIISSGNTDMSSLSCPSLTTLDLNIEYSCDAAIELLLKRIENPNKPYENITINSTLIERDSVKKYII